MARLGSQVAHIRWTDRDAANAAIDDGDRTVFQASVIEAFAVRTKAKPDDEGGTINLTRCEDMVPISTMAVDPMRSDALVGALRTATDAFLPAFRAVRQLPLSRAWRGPSFVKRSW